MEGLTLLQRKRLPRVSAKTGELEPATKSMFKSSLYCKDSFALPQMTAVDNVQVALQNDALSQNLKYDSQLPQSSSARFCIDCPRSPQHLKYCNRTVPSERGKITHAATASIDSDQPSHLTCVGTFLGAVTATHYKVAKPACLESLTACKSKLRLLFSEIDKKGSGFITHRAVMFTLHQRLHEQFGDSDDVRDATSWLREAAKDGDVENTGCMDWKAFLDFCRRACILLEYHTHKTQHDALKDASEVLKEKQDEMRSISCVDIKDKNLELESEIRTKVGSDNAARFNSNRRAGSPEEEALTALG